MGVHEIELAECNKMMAEVMHTVGAPNKMVLGRRAMSRRLWLVKVECCRAGRKGKRQNLAPPGIILISTDKRRGINFPSGGAVREVIDAIRNIRQ